MSSPLESESSPPAPSSSSSAPKPTRPIRQARIQREININTDFAAEERVKAVFINRRIIESTNHSTFEECTEKQKCRIKGEWNKYIHEIQHQQRQQESALEREEEKEEELRKKRKRSYHRRKKDAEEGFVLLKSRQQVCESATPPSARSEPAPDLQQLLAESDREALIRDLAERHHDNNYDKAAEIIERREAQGYQVLPRELAKELHKHKVNLFPPSAYQDQHLHPFRSNQRRNLNQRVKRRRSSHNRRSVELQQVTKRKQNRDIIPTKRKSI